MLRKVQLVGRSRIGPAWLGFNVSDRSYKLKVSNSLTTSIIEYIVYSE